MIDNGYLNANNWSWLKTITQVDIGNTVTNIGGETFYNCSNLTSVTIPDSVTRIGNEAFTYCNNSLFDTTTIPGVQLVDGWAIGYTNTISGNLNLTGVRGIGAGAFVGCSDLTSVTIGNSLTSIGQDAFNGSGLTSLTIPNSVTSIGSAAFSGCTDLTSVIFLGKTFDQVENIEDGIGNKQYPWGIENTSIITVA